MTIELICSGLLHLALQKPPPGSVTEVLGRKTATPQMKKLLIRFLLCLSGTQISTSGTYLPTRYTAKRCQLPPTVEALLTFRKRQLHAHSPVWEEERKAHSSNPTIAWSCFFQHLCACFTVRSKIKPRHKLPKEQFMELLLFKSWTVNKRALSIQAVSTLHEGNGSSQHRWFQKQCEVAVKMHKPECLGNKAFLPQKACLGTLPLLPSLPFAPNWKRTVLICVGTVVQLGLDQHGLPHGSYSSPTS